MADPVKLHELTEALSFDAGDILYLEKDPFGTPLDRYIKKETLQASIGGSGGGGEGILVNGKISVTVSSNDLVVAIKTLALADPSPGDPVTIQIKGVDRSITSALSVTLADGTNWMNLGSAELGTLEQDLFVSLGYKSTATAGVVIGVSRIPFATVYSDFNSTNTNEKHGAFSTAPASTDDVVVIGRIAATLSLAGTSHLWTSSSASAPTSTNTIQRPIYETRLLSWTPTWSNLTTTSSTVNYQYQIRGNSLRCVVELTFGASTSIGGGSSVSHTLPFARSSIYGGSASGPTFVVRLTDASATPGFAGLGVITTTSTVAIVTQLLSGSYLKQALLSSTIPFTWTTSDQIISQFEYLI